VPRRLVLHSRHRGEPAHGQSEYAKAPTKRWRLHRCLVLGRELVFQLLRLVIVIQSNFEQAAAKIVIEYLAGEVAKPRCLISEGHADGFDVQFKVVCHGKSPKGPANVREASLHENGCD